MAHIQANSPIHRSAPYFFKRFALVCVGTNQLWSGSAGEHGMGYLKAQLQSRLLKLLDTVLKTIFDWGEPSLSDVVTRMLENDCRESSPPKGIY